MNGRNHQKAANIVILGGLVAAPLFVSLVGLDGWLAAMSGLITGKYVDPDLRDQHQVINESEREVRRFAGEAAGKAWTIYWQAPAYAINHRSRWSHAPGLGTFVAASWLIVPLLAVYYVVAGREMSPAAFLAWSGQVISSRLILLWFVGWCTQDFTHWLLDLRQPD